MAFGIKKLNNWVAGYAVVLMAFVVHCKYGLQNASFSTHMHTQAPTHTCASYHDLNREKMPVANVIL